MSFKLKNNNIIFIHPPKCGGSSITEALKNSNFIDNEVTHNGVHSSIKLLNSVGITGDEYFVTVRNPYDRFYSFYHFQIEWDKKRLLGDLPLKGGDRTLLIKRVENLEKIKFDGWVELLTNDFDRHRWINTFQVPDAFSNQISWYKGQTNKPVNTFKIEDDTVWSYLQNKGYDVSKKHIKKSTYKSKPYTQEQKNVVYEYFKHDFEELQYEN